MEKNERKDGFSEVDKGKEGRGEGREAGGGGLWEDQ